MHQHRPGEGDVVKVRENIHHGDYRYERVEDVPDLGTDTLHAFLIGSPHIHLVTRSMVQELRRKLCAGITYQHGWSDFGEVQA